MRKIATREAEANAPKILNKELYAEAVKNLAKAKSGERFSNTGAEHASIVLFNIFKSAEKSLRILSGKLDKKVTESNNFYKMKDSLEKYLQKANAQVLIEEVPEDDNEIYSLLVANNADIRIAPDNYKDEYLKGKKVHFTIADDRMYRFETDTSKFKAICSFNEPEIANKLASTFDSIFERSKKHLTNTQPTISSPDCNT